MYLCSRSETRTLSALVSSRILRRVKVKGRSVLRAHLPLVSGQNIYSFSHGFLKAFRADNGLLLWKTPIEGHTVGQIILNNDSIYMTADGKSIFMVKRSDGAIGWHISVAETLTSPLTIDGTTLYYSTNQNLLFARNAESSSLLWKKELSGVIPDRTGQSQLYTSGHIIIYINQGKARNQQENKVLALSDTTGSVVWSNHLDGWPVRAATLSHNTITILSLNGLVVPMIYTVEGANGTLLLVMHTYCQWFLTMIRSL